MNSNWSTFAPISRSIPSRKRRHARSQWWNPRAALDALKGKVLDAAAIDKLVADRSALCVVAAKIAPTVKLDGLADVDIKKAVVTAKLGDAAIKDKSADYINARFDILAEDAGKTTTTDTFRNVVKDGRPHPHQRRWRDREGLYGHGRQSEACRLTKESPNQGGLGWG